MLYDNGSSNVRLSLVGFTLGADPTPLVIENFANDTGLKEVGFFTEFFLEWFRSSAVALRSVLLVSVSDPPLPSPMLN